MSGIVNDSRDRVVDDNGIVRVRGGQTVGESLFGSIQAAYQNLTYHPVAVFILIFSIFMLIAEQENSDGPIEILIKRLVELAFKYKTVRPWLYNIIAMILLVLDFIMAHKMTIAYIGLVIVPYIAKPSSRNLVVAIILIFMVWLKTLSGLEIFVLSQLFYLFVMLRSPGHKFLVLIIFLLVFWFGVIEINSVAKKYFAESPPDPPKSKIQTHSTTKRSAEFV